VTLETAAASTSAGSLLGRVIDGRYRLEEELGGGAAGSTHRARRAEDSRLVVLKLFDEDVSGDAVRRSRFEWEAATLAGLAHPNVVPILDYGVFAGRRYLVSEWLDGESLAQRMRRAQLPLTAAVGIIRQILAALASVHSARLAHRNLKPTDVYLEWRKQGRERVKLLDFAPVMRPVMRPGVVATGRGSYVPPEVATGEPLDARSDVYAVGALLSGMLHGGPPDAPVLAGPAPTGARRGPVVDSTLQGWIRRAMARDRQERFADAAEMLQQLIDLLPRDLRSPPEGYEASRVSSVSIPSPVRSDTRRNESMRPDSSRSQTMRTESFAPANVSTGEREPTEARGGVETESVAHANRESRETQLPAKSKDSVTAESRLAFARSERARAFIEARAKGRTRSATPSGVLDPAQANAEAAPARTGETSAGGFIAEPRLESRAEPAAAASVIEAPQVDSQPQVVQVMHPDASFGEPLEELVRPTIVEAAEQPAPGQTQTQSDDLALAEASPQERAVAAPEAPDSIAYDVDLSSSSESRAIVTHTQSIEQPRESSGRSWASVDAEAESVRPIARSEADATGSATLESVKLAAVSARSRGWSPSNRPPNRKARREAARLAALHEHISAPASIDAARAKRARMDDESTRANSRPRPRPRSTDHGSVRDAVVGSAALWFSRLARHARFSPSVGHGSLIAAGVLCVVVISVVSLRSLDFRDGNGAGTVQTAVDSTSSPPAVSHGSVGSETAVAPATAPADDTDDTASAAESGLSNRPPAVNPWKDDLLPPELDGIPALANKGEPGDEPTVRRLREYSRFNENDARGLLLLGRLYMNRYWRTDALTQFQLAVERDPSARGAPEIMAALLELIVTGKATEPAEAFILRVYGREALPSIEAELEKLQKPMSIQRLSAVRAKLLDR
jgi:serine/threonine protein kinase